MMVDSMILRFLLVLSLFSYITYAQEGFCFRPAPIPNEGGISPPPNLSNDRYAINTVIRFACRPGYVLNGPESVTCRNRVWELPSQANGSPRCQLPATPVIPVITTAVNPCNGCPQNRLCAVLGGIPRCVCRDGFIEVGQTCQRDTGITNPVCRGGCPVANSICVIFQGAPNCICAPGFIEVGRSCQSRSLVQPALGQCGGRCPPNSRCSIFSDQRTPVCVCNVGFLVFERRGCVPRPRPVAPEGCLRPSPSTNRNTAPDNTQQVWNFGDIIIYTCNPPYLISGQRRARCLPSGQFMFPPPTCIEPVTPRTTVGPTQGPSIQCIVPSPPSNGFINPGNRIRFNVGETVQFGCIPPLTIRGDTSTTCQASGQFSPANPACVAVQPTVGPVPPVPPVRPQQSCVFPIPPQNGNFFPRRDIWTVGDIVDYRCNPGFRLVGIARSRCLSNGLFTSEPPLCEGGVICTLPFVPFGGSINTPAKLQYLPGDRVIYTCRNGFTLSGTSTIFCRNDGSYSAPFPSCNSDEEMVTAGPVMCLNPNVPSNGFTLPPGQTVWTPGTFVTFACRSGFDLAGASTSRCNEDGNFETVNNFCISTATPSPAPITCSRPPNPVNGFVIAALGKQTWQVGESIRYVCEGSFTLNGEETALCQNTGLFPPAPICEATPAPAVTCGRPSPPSDGFIIGSAGQTIWQLGEQIRWGCSDGFLLAGDEFSTCQASGNFGFSPFCIRAFTPAPVTTCNRLTTPANGEILGDPTQQTWQVGENLLFNCFGGYNLIGNEFVTCQNDGFFNGVTPICQAVRVVPTAATCTAPPPPLDGSIVNARSAYAEGQSANFECNTGFRLVGLSRIVCLSTGRFSGALPVCQRVPVTTPPPQVCFLPVAPQFGSINNPQQSYAVGNFITFSCNEGYNLVGASLVTCQSNGQFSSSPTCQAVTTPQILVTCIPPPGPTNGAISNFRPRYNVGDRIIFECDDDYNLLGSETSTCQSNGQFSGDLPVCRAATSPPPPLTCLRPTAPLFGAINGPLPSYTVGSLITFRCDDGYTLVGSPLSTCQSNGEFSSIPTCIQVRTQPPTAPPVTCPAPSINFGSIINGQTFYSPSDTIRITCQPPFEPQGPESATCLSTGQFTELPRCGLKIVDTSCSVSPPDGGLIVGGSTSAEVGQLVQFACNSPFTLLGDNTILCRADGTLEANPPVCTECVPDPPENGFTTGNATYWRRGDLITYDCRENYTVTGFPTSLCQANGVILGTPPICEEGPIDVPTCMPPIPQNGSIEEPAGATEVPVGKLYRYTCNAGYVLNGLARGICLETGPALDPPTCEPV